MHVTIRRYEGVDEARTGELVTSTEDNLAPQLSKLPGFNGYYLVQSSNGVFTSINVFDTEADGEESTRVASSWVREENFETALPNPPAITRGEVVVEQSRELIEA